MEETGSKEADPRPPFDPRARDAERQSAFKPSVSIPVGVAPVPDRKLGAKPEYRFVQPDPRGDEEAFRSAGAAMPVLPPRVPPMPSTTPPEIKSSRTCFVAGATKVPLRGISPGPKMGEVFHVASEPLIKVPPLLPERKPIDVMGSEVITLMEKGQESMPLPPSQMSGASIRPVLPLPPPPMRSVQPASMPSQMRQSPPPPAFEEPKPGISIERMVFLERVERIMASEARIKEIEAENKTLVGMVSRLNKELEELKAKLAARLP